MTSQLVEGSLRTKDETMKLVCPSYPGRCACEGKVRSEPK